MCTLDITSKLNYNVSWPQKGSFYERELYFKGNKLKSIPKRTVSQNKREHFAFGKRALFVSSQKLGRPCPLAHAPPQFLRSLIIILGNETFINTKISRVKGIGLP